MKRMSLSAVKLRIILLIVLVLTLTAIGAGFYFAQKMLRGYATETSTLNSKVSVSNENIAALKNLQSYLASHKDVQDKTKQIVADSKNYNYQNEIVNDINAFAAKSGISITSYDFSTGASTSTPAPSTATPTAPAAGGATTPNATSSALRSTKVSVNIKSPVAYASLLNFIHRIEQNVTKMQIQSISLTKSGDDSKLVASEGFTIEVYIK